MTANSPLPKGKDFCNYDGKGSQCDEKASRFSFDMVTGKSRNGGPELDPLCRFRNDYGKKKHVDETGLNILPIGSVQFPVR